MTGFLVGTVSGITDKPTATRAASITLDTPPLRLLGHACRKESSYLICEGEVRNQADQRLESVMAEVRFTNREGTFVKAESAMLDYQPLMPGQTSPFVNRPSIFWTPITPVRGAQD